MPDSAKQLPPVVRKRLAPGERRTQILQTLAAMLEAPGGERITTATLAAQLGVSEAALYRHFASKAQMFEGLIDFIEQTVFSLVNQINADRPPNPLSASGPAQGKGVVPSQRAGSMLKMLMQFAEKNPGMARVMVGDALVLENTRLQERMNLFFDKFEAALKQVLRDPSAMGGDAKASLQANALHIFAIGRLHRFVRSGFRRLPTEQLDAHLQVLLG